MSRSMFHGLRGLLAALFCGAVLGACPSPVERGAGGAPAGPLGAAEMKAGVAHALATNDSLDRTTEIVDLMRRLDATNLPGALAAYEEGARGIDARDAVLFANAWARIDYEAAIDRFLTFPNPSAQFQAVAEVIFYKAGHGGAKEVREYAEKSIQGSTTLSVADKATANNIIVDAAARGLAAAGEFDELTKLLEILPADRSRSFLITKTLLELGRNEGQVRKWAEGIPWDAQNQLKKDVMRPVLAMMAGHDGRGASRWYDEIKSNLEPGEWLGDIGNPWAQEQPVDSIEWLLSQPPSDARRMALRTAAYEFLRKDGPAGSEWIKGHLDQPDIHSHMLFPLVQYIISVDIQQALPLAQQIEGNGDKIAALKQILMIWSRKDYDAVKRYMAEVGVPQEVADTVNGHNEIRIQRRKAKEAAAAAAGQG